MTDKEQFMLLFEECGITWRHPAHDSTKIVVEANSGKKVHGSSGACAELEFFENGFFRRISIWG